MKPVKAMTKKRAHEVKKVKRMSLPSVTQDPHGRTEDGFFGPSALIPPRRIAGAFAGVVRKGDADAGAVLVKVATMDRLEARRFMPGAGTGEDERIWLIFRPGLWGR